MAKIETGCVVFGENARLVYYNPAFLTLFPVKEEWCASKPTLTETLYELRNLGMLPEKRDFATFRSNLTGHFEPGEAPYREEWVLPTGQTLKVEGQQLPGDYVALTFQDLTELKTTEARFHTERADGRTILDQFEQPVACFDPCGDMTAANRAFQRLWKLDQRTETPFTIKDLACRGEVATGVSPVWGNLRSFATGTLQRSKTRSEIATEMDVTMTCQYAPLPSQGTVVSFHTSMAKDPAIRVSETAVRASDLVTDLETLSTKRGIGLILEGWDNGPEIECGALALKRLMSALIVALSPSPRKGAEIWIALDSNEGGVQFTITQSAPGIYPDLSESVAGRLAMRLAKEFGARLEAKDGELHLWLPKAEENPPQEETGTTGAA
jgi:PAS domain-containing protein